MNIRIKVSFDTTDKVDLNELHSQIKQKYNANHVSLSITDLDYEEMESQTAVVEERN